MRLSHRPIEDAMRKAYIKKKKKRRRWCYPGTQTRERERERNQPLEKPGGCTPAVVRVQSERAQQQSPTKNERQ